MCGRVRGCVGSSRRSRKVTTVVVQDGGLVPPSASRVVEASGTQLSQDACKVYRAVIQSAVMAIDEPVLMFYSLGYCLFELVHGRPFESEAEAMLFLKDLNQMVINFGLIPETIGYVDTQAAGSEVV